MASKDNEVEKPIIVKKIKKGGHGHHGGAWKVAYADFVTAMMAFFLLMWLLNVTTDEQKNAISNYFDPTNPVVSSELSGSGGILGGMTMSPDGAQVSNVQNVAVPTTQTTPRSGMALGDQRDQLGTSEYRGDTFDPEIEGNKASDTDKTASTEDEGDDLREGVNVLETMDDIIAAEIEQLQAIVEESQNEDFESVKQKILEEVKKSPELADLEDHLMIDITPEGLRIQIVDKEGRSMFPSGSATMFDFMNQLVEKVTQVVIPQTNQISIRGHTDGKPYPPGAKYNNWNLSTDRALASQNSMLDAGLPDNRVENVIGKSDKEHLLPETPLSPRNRRISIVLLREKMANADEIRRKAAEAIEKKRLKMEQETEDTRDIPELDNVAPRPPSAEFTDNTDDSTTETVKENPSSSKEETESEDLIGDQIKTIRERNAGSPQAPNVKQPKANEDIQILEFP